MRKLHNSLLGVMLLVTAMVTAQNPKGEAIPKNRLQHTLKGQQVISLTTAHPHKLSEYIKSHSEVELLQFSDGVYTIAFDSRQVLSNISYFLSETLQSATTHSRFTPNLQSILNSDQDDQLLNIVVTLHKGEDIWSVADHLMDSGLKVDPQFFGKTLNLKASKDQISLLQQMGEISSVDLQDEAVQALNYESRIVQKNTVLHAASLVGGYGLTGAGVTIGVGDGGELGDHLDFGQRVINQANGTYASFGAHGDHVSGIIGASGMINPRHKGIAPGAQIVTQKTTQIVANAEQYADAYGMSLTNNSYGVSFNCETNGTYNYNSVNLDYLSRTNPKLLHIFAAGNNGTKSCIGYPDGYGTVLRNYQSSKNVLTVGAVNHDRQLADISARGPVADGRIKPEIVASGMNVTSTGNNFNYYTNNGTSMAAPALTGSLALLIEQYRKIHGEDPDGALLKAIACNTADDLGNPGPDFAYGFGLINARRAVETILDGRHAQGILQSGEQNTHTLSIPSGVKEVKIMLYWHDMEASAYPNKALVNDLNIQVVSPGQNEFLPWVLNTNPEAVDQPALKGVDTLNNIEQVSINFPSEGIYTITVDGQNIFNGNQKYYLTYEFIKEEVRLTYPLGNEIFTPDKYQLIAWDTETSNQFPFRVSYSDNSGQSWEIIGDNIDADARSFAWNVPNAMTEEGIVKVEKIGGPVLSAQSKSFSIKQNLTGFEVNPICEGMVQFLWGYGDGEIYPTSAIQLQGEETITLEVANNNFYTHLKPLAEGEKHWFAVAHPQGEKGAGRTIAKSVIPTYNAICPWTDDVKLTAEPTTYTGRFATSSSKFTIQLPVIVKNIGSQDQEDLEINYQLEGTHVDKIPGVLASGDQYTFNLIKTVRDMQPGIYPVDLYTNIPGDPTANHYLDDIVEVEIIPNAPVELPFELEIPTAVHYSYDQSEMGLEQLQRMDFQQNGEGRLDVSSWNGEGAVIVHSQNHGEFNEALITLNMKNYAIDNQVNLNLRYATEGSGNATFYVRGSDQDDWVLISELTNTQEWVEIENIAINDLLAQANHEFSASTQLKIVQNGIGAIGISDIIIDGDIVVNLPDYQNHLLSVVADQNYYLTWTNNYENYGYSYEIQYAQDSLALTRDQYDVYQIITGQGETLTGRTYDVELEGLATNQRYFFRIKTIDESGAEYLSNISSLLLIDNSIEKGLAMQLKNLVEGDLNVNFSVPSRSRIQINLISSNGARVYSESITLDEGIHSHAINSGIMAQKGLYLLEVQSHQETLQQKIVKH